MANLIVLLITSLFVSVLNSMLIGQRSPRSTNHSQSLQSLQNDAEFVAVVLPTSNEGDNTPDHLHRADENVHRLEETKSESHQHHKSHSQHHRRHKKRRSHPASIPKEFLPIYNAVVDDVKASKHLMLTKPFWPWP